MKSLNAQLKKVFLTVALLGTVQGTLLASTPEERRVPVTHIYSPMGFDSNDRAEIIITGYLPNLCHKYPFSKVKVEGSTVKVELTSLYYEVNNPFCAQMIVPFEQVVQVGVLNKERYKIEVNGGESGEEKSTLGIKEATTNAIDEEVYASVDSIVKNEEQGTVKLSGHNPSDCYIFDQVKIVSNGVDTYSVLPVMKQIYSNCPAKMVPFEVEFTVPQSIQKDEVLIHVRSMSGNSLNTIFNRKRN